jgi:aminoglycoside phosphotransferase (APT) family kinase protein
MLLADDIELVAGDPALPGLATVLDDEALRDALQERLPTLPVDVARVVSARYRPGRRCIVRYKLEAAGKELDGYAAAYTPDSFLRAAPRIAAAIHVIGHPPVTVSLPEVSVIARVFPSDPALPVLQELNDGPGRKRLLSELAPEHPGFRDADIDTLHYTPERKFTSRLMAGRRPLALLKAYREEPYSRVSAVVSTLGSRGMPRLPRLIGHSDTRYLLAFEWLPGRPLGEVLRDMGFGSELFHLAGGALAELHARPATSLRPWNSRFRARLAKRAAWIRQVESDLADLADSLAARLGRETAETRSFGSTLHGDFYPNQVLVGNGSVSIIDLDDCASGDPAADLGSFVAHLERQACAGALTSRQLEEAREQLLAGYAERAGHSPDQSRLLSYTAADMFTRATGAFRRRQPEWRQRLRLLLSRAQELLDAR